METEINRILTNLVLVNRKQVADIQSAMIDLQDISENFYHQSQLLTELCEVLAGKKPGE